MAGLLKHDRERARLTISVWEKAQMRSMSLHANVTEAGRRYRSRTMRALNCDSERFTNQRLANVFAHHILAMQHEKQEL
jgi:hypothetical protein